MLTPRLSSDGMDEIPPIFFNGVVHWLYCNFHAFLSRNLEMYAISEANLTPKRPG